MQISGMIFQTRSKT
ncbi:hypothetical protein [Anaerobutyricum hallii]